MSATHQLSYTTLLQKAWPIFLANASVPLLGLVDTAVIGNIGTVADLGAIALGALIFSFVYWSFGFLRMSTTGFIAQALGAGDDIEVRAVLGRAVLLAIGLSLLVMLLQLPIGSAAFSLLSGSEAVESLAGDYFSIRIWGAPATLCTFVFMGLLIGLGYSKHLLIAQLFLNGLNIGLDIYFAGVLGWGVRGIALGTVIAEWCALLFSAWLIIGILKKSSDNVGPFWPWQRIMNYAKIMGTLSANRDIMIRTLLLMFSFAWFTNQSARFGASVLAANHILLQLIALSAFILDAYAFVVESLVGKALGLGKKPDFDLAVQRSTILALVTALLLALLVLGFGEWAVAILTDLTVVRQTANDMLWLVAIYVLLSFAAFQLDGIFIGASFTKQMRNASIVSSSIFILTGWWLISDYGETGLWLAFIIFVCVRAASLLWYYPQLSAAIATSGFKSP